jgi:hypothetical protein
MRNNFTPAETAAILAEHYPWAAKAAQEPLEDIALAVHFGVGQVLRALEALEARDGNLWKMRKATHE